MLIGWYKNWKGTSVDEPEPEHEEEQSPAVNIFVFSLFHPELLVHIDMIISAITLASIHCFRLYLPRMYWYDS